MHSLTLSETGYSKQSDQRLNAVIRFDISTFYKIGSCFTLLFFSVAATILAELSKTSEGKYPYNSFAIPCVVEAMKFTVSAIMISCSKSQGAGSCSQSFSLQNSVLFSKTKCIENMFHISIYKKSFL